LTLREWTDATAWDTFVRAHAESRYCQLFGYGSVVSSYYNIYRPRTLAFMRNGDLVGVLPATEVCSVLYGRRLISQPFSEYGGMLLHPELSNEDVQGALHALQSYLARLGRPLEIHGNHGLASLPGGEPVGQIAYLRLTPDTETLWRNVVRPSVRNKVKQAQTHGVTTSFDNSEATLRQAFFPLYLKSMKRLGVPPHQLAYYTRSLTVFGDDMLLAIARAADGTPIAGLLGFSCGSRVSIINSVSDEAHWNLRANDLLHWEMIRRSAESGHRIFDFGSVRYEGQSTYKKKWGTEFTNHHNYLLPGDRSNVMIRSSSDRMKQMSHLWSKYVPNAIGRRLGPIIRGQLAR
jgi:CelD/BcsL family acetyltransferase involved in cellulose biosynthesis